MDNSSEAGASIGEDIVGVFMHGYSDIYGEATLIEISCAMHLILAGLRHYCDRIGLNFAEVSHAAYEMYFENIKTSGWAGETIIPNQVMN